MSDFWEGYEPEPTRPAPVIRDELTEPLGCVVVRPLVANRATPPAAQRQWVGLTDEDKLHIEIMGGKSDVMLAELVEAKLKEKNT
jgi:hypothetical protein